jgi:hypothetical protein
MTSTSVENDRSNLGVINDPDVKVKLGSTFQSHSEKLSDFVDKFKGKEVLSIGDIKLLWKILRESNANSGGDRLYLHDLLCDAKLVVPTLEVPKRNPELEKRVTALRNSLAEQEYQKMTQNVNLTSRFKQEDSIGYQSMISMLKDKLCYMFNCTSGKNEHIV